MTACRNQTTGLTNGKEANWAPEVEFSPFHTLSRRQLTFPFCCYISLIYSCHDMESEESDLIRRPDIQLIPAKSAKEIDQIIIIIHA